MILRALQAPTEPIGFALFKVSTLTFVKGGLCFPTLHLSPSVFNVLMPNLAWH